MLHIVNGDSVGDKLKEGKLAGNILVWRELYSEGPLYVWPDQYPYRDVRADHMTRALGIPRELWIDTCEAQQLQLGSFADHDEIVLWFEYDLFDQSMLGYLLHWFSYYSYSLENTKISLICIGEFPGVEDFRGLGQLTSKQLTSLFGDRVQIGQPELYLGRRAWEAYVSTDPRDLLNFLKTDTRELPYIHSAFMAHLNRFPSCKNGLGIVEQTTIELLHQGHDTPLQLFQQFSNQHHVLGYGDLQYWLTLRRMSQGMHPLLLLEDNVSFPNFKKSVENFLSTPVRMTDLGQQLLNETSDWISLNGIEKWLGGVHLQGNVNVWRWNCEDGSLELK